MATSPTKSSKIGRSSPLPETHIVAKAVSTEIVASIPVAQPIDRTSLRTPVSLPYPVAYQAGDMSSKRSHTQPQQPDDPDDDVNEPLVANGRNVSSKLRTSKTKASEQELPHEPNAVGERGETDMEHGIQASTGHGWVDEPLSDASDRWCSDTKLALLFAGHWLLTRFVTLVLLLLGDSHHWLNNTAASFFALELILTAYYWHMRQYFPGSIYTYLHVLIYHRKLQPVYLHNRFSASFRFVFGLWGYFVVSGVLLNVEQWGTSSNLLLQVCSYVILLLSLKEILLYTPVIVVWWISLLMTLYYFLCCWFMCLSTGVLPLLQDVSAEDRSYPFYKWIFEHVG